MDLPWKTRITVALLSLVTDICRRSDGTVNRRLLRLFDFRSPPTRSGGVSSSDHTIDASRNLWLRLLVPDVDKSSLALPVLLFFHGGGFAFLSPDSFVYDAVCRKLARLLPAVVASVNYRLSPEHRYPCQYEDGFDALGFLGARLGHLLPPGGPAADLSRCFLGGDSAGANVAHHVAVRASREKAENVRVVGVIAIQPFFGGEERTEAERRLTRAAVVSVERTDWLWKAFLPEGADRNHAAANVSGPNAEDISRMKEYPKTVVVVGGLDPLQDWQRRYYWWLRDSGKDAILLEYPDMIHAFYIFPELPQSRRLLLQLKDFVASVSPPSTSSPRR